jgi:hypothetical protein
MQHISLDVASLILSKLNEQRDHAALSMVCRSWYKATQSYYNQYLINPTLKAAISLFKFKTSFKIVKYRFLLRKWDLDDSEKVNELFEMANREKFWSDSYPYFYLHLNSSTTTRNHEITLSAVGEDEAYVIYEADVITSARYNSLRWTIYTGHGFGSVDRNSQIIPDDTNVCYFGTGNTYKNPGELVIGSTGSRNFNFVCCCAINLLPLRC